MSWTQTRRLEVMSRMMSPSKLDLEEDIEQDDELDSEDQPVETPTASNAVKTPTCSGRKKTRGAPMGTPQLYAHLNRMPRDGTYNLPTLDMGRVQSFKATDIG